MAFDQYSVGVYIRSGYLRFRYRVEMPCLRNTKVLLCANSLLTLAMLPATIPVVVMVHEFTSDVKYGFVDLGRYQDSPGIRVYSGNNEPSIPCISRSSDLTCRS